MRTIKVSLILFAFVSTLLMAGSMGAVASFSAPNIIGTPADADLDRVLWQAEHYSNPGFEDWIEWYLPDDVQTSFYQEEYTNYVTAPWPVSEGSRSFLMQAKALAPINLPEARLSRGTWIFWNNPTNLTLSMDWYIDNLATPVDGDVFELRVYLGNPGDRIMHYYLGCDSTTAVNGSQAYFMIEGPSAAWNTLSRNITQDFFDVFGNYPTEFQYFHVALTSRTPELSRVLIDDIQMVNGTVIIGGATENGNFETGGAWYADSDYSPALVSQSDMAIEGDYSLNMTVMSNGNQTRTRIEYDPYVWTSADNMDTLKFSWRMEERTLSTSETRAYIYVSCSNETEEFYVYYLLTYGDLFLAPLGNTIIMNATGFNTTGQWHSFERSVYADLAEFFEFNNLRIDEIQIHNYARVKDARTEILIDDISLTCAALGDMSYESQGEIGEEIVAWRDTESTFTVTDMSHSGSKAANLTTDDSHSVYLHRDFGHMPVNDATDIWIDLYWYLDDNSGPDNELYLELYFYDTFSDDSRTLAYFLANTSAISTENGWDAVVLLDEANSLGTWHSLQRNLYDDCFEAFGSDFDGMLEDIYLVGQSSSGSRLEAYFDDVYIYEDPEPAISNIVCHPLEPIDGEDIVITATVYDASLLAVYLYHRVNNGTWTSVEMVWDGSYYNATLSALTEGDDLEIYILATDRFDNVAISEYSSYEVVSAGPPPPSPSILPLIVGGVIAGLVILVLFYMFYYKPKQTAS